MMLTTPGPPATDAQGMDTPASTSRLSKRWRDLLIEMAASKDGFNTQCSASGVFRLFTKRGITDIGQRKVRLQLQRMAKAGYLERIALGRYQLGARAIELVEDHRRAEADAAKS